MLEKKRRFKKILKWTALCFALLICLGLGALGVLLAKAHYDAMNITGSFTPELFLEEKMRYHSMHFSTEHGVTILFNREPTGPLPYSILWDMKTKDTWFDTQAMIFATQDEVIRFSYLENKSGFFYSKNKIGFYPLWVDETEEFSRLNEFGRDHGEGSKQEKP